MSGSVEEIVPNATSHIVDQGEKSLLEDILYFLVYEQFVDAPALGSRLWRVQRGTGMGLCHSGYVADILLLNMCERVLVNPQTLLNCGIDRF